DHRGARAAPRPPRRHQQPGDAVARAGDDRRRRCALRTGAPVRDARNAAPAKRDAVRTPALALVLLLCAAAPAGAPDEIAAFYQGKQLRIVVGTAPGGG